MGRLVADSKLESDAINRAIPGSVIEPGFHGVIQVEYVDGVYWKLLSEYVYCSPLLDTCIRMPAGTLSNFASIPKVFWWWMNPVDKEIAAASLVHDQLYHDPDYLVTRKEADQLLVEGMEYLGASSMKRWSVYRFIRQFGSNYTPRVVNGKQEK